MDIYWVYDLFAKMTICRILFLICTIKVTGISTVSGYYKVGWWPLCKSVKKYDSLLASIEWAQNLLKLDLSHITHNIVADKSGPNPIRISEFLKTDMTKKVIVAMVLPPMDENSIIRLYKVGQRNQVWDNS